LWTALQNESSDSGCLKSSDHQIPQEIREHLFLVNGIAALFNIFCNPDAIIVSANASKIAMSVTERPF
jgi:hypothetical protein